MGCLVSCCVCSTASCCAKGLCKCCCKSLTFGVQKSVATRLIYTVQLVLFTIIAWLFNILPYVTKKYDWAWDKIPGFKNCTTEDCFGVMGVYRITSGFAFFHFAMALLLIRTKSSTDWRSSIQDGWWFFKVLAIVGSILITFFIPSKAYIGFGWIALIGAGIFVLMQLILLVDFAHSWNESWVSRHESSTNKVWAILLLVATIAMNLCAIVISILLFVYFNECSLNTTFISANIIICIAFSILSIHPKIQDKNPRSGLLQSAVVSIFSTYLVASALMSEPDDMKCKKIDTNGSKFTLIIGIVFAFIAVGYAAFNVSGSSIVKRQEKDEDEANSSLLEESNIEEQDEIEEEEMDDEKNATTYSYTGFHLTFVFAALYVSMILTNWELVSPNKNDDYLRVDVGLPSVWVKIVSGWLVALLYSWTIIAPIVLKNREF